MDTDWQIKLLILFVLFILSAFFSGSEIALFSLNRNKLKHQLDNHPILCDYLQKLLQFPRRLLVTILIGNTIVNVAASIASLALALKYASYLGISNDVAITGQIVIITILIIIFGELVPKVWAAKNPIAFAKIIVVPLYWISVALFPISEFFSEIIKLLLAKVKYDKTKSAISPEDISNLAVLSREAGSLLEREEGLIKGIVSFRSIEVHEIMTPRVDIVAVSLETNFKDLINIISESGHSRIPLYNEDIDEIVGLIIAKDILPFIKQSKKVTDFSLKKLARKTLFIPEKKLIGDLMQEFQEKKMHLAVVVDEYGGTSGVITFEDILEEIIGEIRDEYDKEENLIEKIDENNYVVLGKLTIDELNEILNANFEQEENNFETVGGMIFNYSGKIPEEGYSFVLNDFKFTVKEIIEKRINKVAISKNL